MAPRPPVLVIAGPTASGKSALALAVAARHPATVINADSMQLYAELRVLTARPGPEDEVRAPHRLYGVRPATQPCSAAEWADLARAEVERTWGQGRLPVLVGGTGLYLRTLLDGIAPVPEIDEGVRAAVRAMDAGTAWEALRRADPAGAARLQASDPQRVKRALEVVLSTGSPLGAWQAMRTGGLGEAADVRAVVVDVPAAELAARIELRWDAMVAAGARGEVAALSGLDPGLPLMKACGVRPLLAELSGALPPEAAREAALAETRQYAKRQRTWFRNQCAAWERVAGGEGCGGWGAPVHLPLGSRTA
jgi:tRNA dimethylallyltransferase